MANAPDNESFKSGTILLEMEPSSLTKKGQTTPQIAKDFDYASAIIKAWKEDLEVRSDASSDPVKTRSVAAPLVYKNEADEELLHGHIYRPSPPTILSSEERKIPGIVLFHTGAGPQDIFLRWKADSLVNDVEVFGKNGCVVLIADILGDGEGWAWDSDRSRYNSVRTSILVPDDSGERNVLSSRVKAAIDTISAQPNVDSNSIIALGFCLGGHPILELARMKIPSVKLMATFHGVFDGVKKLSHIESSSRARIGKDGASPSILVCTGEQDPFVPDDDLDAALTMMNDLGYKCQLIKMDNTRHGFTNPAQDFNPNPSFAYNHDASMKAWSAVRSLARDLLAENKVK